MDNNSMDFHNIVDTIEHCKEDCKAKKMKDSILLLKRKMYKTHDLIKQYSENMKEIDHLKSNLEIAKKEAKHTISNYKSAMDKIRELELKIIEDKEKYEKLINKINEYEINAAADKQTTQQLTCKIKDLEEEHSVKVMEYNLEKSYFEGKIKDLEHELKKLKGTTKKRGKKMILTDIDTTKPSIGTKSSSDIGINVSLCDNELSTKREVQDKSILTDEFYNMKDDPHPLFCAKCEAHLLPDITPEKIYKTMSTYPKLIEKDLSPLSKKIYSPPCSLPSTYLDSINRNEDALSRISMPHLRSYSPFSDLIVGNLKPQSGRTSTMTQISEKLELRNVDSSHIPVSNLSNNPNSVPTALTLSQSKNGVRENFCSDNLLIEHSSSIKEMERKIRLLEIKMKKFRRLKEKMNTNCHSNCTSCRCITNYKDGVSLNSNLISIICKGMAEYYNEKREACSKNEQNINSEKRECTCCTKKTINLKRKQQSDNCDANVYIRDAFSWEVEKLDEKRQVRNTICNKIENVTTDILQSENTLSAHKKNSFPDINTSSTSRNAIDETDQRKFVFHEKNTVHSTEVALDEDNLTTSHLSADDIYTSDDSLGKGNAETINRDNQIEIGTMSLSNDENSIDHADDKIVDINIEKSKIKRTSQNIHEDKVNEIYASDDLLDKDNIETINRDNQIEIRTMSLSNDENSIDCADKIVDINIEKSKIKRKSQNIHKDKIGEIYASDDFLSKDNIEAINEDNQIETGTISLSNDENSIDHADDKIVDIDIEKSKIKRTAQNIHKDKDNGIHANDDLLNKDNIEAIDMDNQTEIRTTSLSNDENFIENDDKIVHINAEENKIKRKGQNICKDKIGEICTSDNISTKDNIEAIDMDNQTETGTTFSSNDENFIDSYDKIVHINAEENKIKRKDQNIHKDKVGKIYASDNLLSKDNVEVINMDNQTKTGTISNNKNSIDDVDDKIVDMNKEENKIKRKSQTIHEDKIDKVCTNDNLLNKDNVEAIVMDNYTETGTTSLSNDENFVDSDNKIIHINADKNKIKRKGQNIHKDKIGEICTSDNLSTKDNIEAIDMDNQIETETTSLFNDENFIDSDDKIVHINAEENKIKRKGQNIRKDKIDEICTSDNLSTKDNIEAINMDNQTETGMTSLSNDENFIDSDDEIVHINTKENKIKRKDQNIRKDKIGEICTSDNLLTKDNVETIDMDNHTETGTTSLSNDENFIDTDNEIVHINAEENKIKKKGQDIHKDKIDEICTSNNLLTEDNVEADMDNQTETGMTSLSNDENSIDHADGKIIEIINAKNCKVKRKSQNMHRDKVGNRLLKKIRCLKRKSSTQASTRINKQENIESCSDHNSEYNRLAKKPRIENGEKTDDPLESSKTIKKKLSTQAETINEQEHNECFDYYTPAKKLRIAHTPKVSISQLSNNENNFTHSIIRSISTLVTREKANGNQLNTLTRKDNLLTKSEKSHTISKECDEKNMMKPIETNSIDSRFINEKDLDLTSTKDCLQNNDITNEFKKHDVFIEDTCNKSIAMDRVTGKTSNNSDESNVLHNNITNDTMNDLEPVESIPLKTCIITQSKSSTFCKDTKHDKLTETLDTIEIRKRITTTTKLESANDTLGKKIPNAISNDKLSIIRARLTALEASYNNSETSDVLSPRSPSPINSIIVEDTNDNNMKESLDEVKNATYKRKKTCNNKTIEIQSINSKKTRRKSVRVNQPDKEKKFIDISHREESQSHTNKDISDEATIRSPSPENNSIVFEYGINGNNMKDEVQHDSHDVEESQTPMSQLIKYINKKRMKKHNLPNKKMRYVCKITDKFVKKQLEKLINSAWEDSVHDDVMEKLTSTCGPRIIAKCTVEFLLENVDHSEALDKTFTPPAPMMTPSEQKIITLLIDLETLKPTVIHFVQAAIEYNLFRLKTDVKIQVDSLTRIYVVLSRIQKDRERIRMMCCNALYCMGLKAIGVLYTVLTCWPEVLPNADVHKGILPKCIAFLIGSQFIDDIATESLQQLFNKLHTLKKLIIKFYNYTYLKETTNDIVKELMTALKAERIDGLDTAIILVAKREGPAWTYKNIIESALLPMIIKNEHPCIYSAFALLGKLLRAFPLQDENTIVKDISEQLCDLIRSGQGSDDQQEGIISALLNLSRHQWDIIAPCVIKWMPSKSLRPIVNTQLQAFINARNPKYWKSYLQSKHIRLVQSRM